jgi:hypothetical protein
VPSAIASEQAGLALVREDLLQQLDGLCQHLCRALRDEPVRLRPEVLVQLACGLQHVADVLQREVTVGEPGGHHRFGHHADKQDALAGQGTGQVEEPVEQVAAEDVAGHVARRRHPLQPAPPGTARGPARRVPARAGSCPPARG